MAKVKVVTSRKTDADTVYDFRCPYPAGCGVPGGDSFASTGWAQRKDAVDRGKQHIAEHEQGEPMQELHAFRVDRGLTPNAAGEAARPPDWEF
jgi:hypothetical protein